MSPHWRDRVEMDAADPWLLGEDENGDLWVPDVMNPGKWHARFNPRNPWHWKFWVRSRRRLRLAMIELDAR